MSKLFEQVLKESDNTHDVLDPYENLYFTIDENKEDDIKCDLKLPGKTYKFIWDRKKSNKNVLLGRGSFYLARFAYADKYRFLNNQKALSGDKVQVKVKNKKEEARDGLLAALSLKTLGYSKDSTHQLKNIENRIKYLKNIKVLLIVKVKENKNRRIRIISFQATDDGRYIEAYIDNFLYNEEFFEDSLDIKDLAL